MAGRKLKENADYFSHDADASSDEKVLYIESKFGLTGYAFYFKMLEILTRANRFEIEINEISKGILARKIGITLEEFTVLIAECTRPEIKLFEMEGAVLFSPGLKKRFNWLLEKRGKDRNRISDTENSIFASENSLIASENDTVKVSKVKESIVKQSKGKETESEHFGTENKPEDFTPTTPTLFNSSLFTPTNYDDDAELKSRITLMLVKFCKVQSPDTATVSRFFNIITKNPKCTRKTAHRITLETCSEYRDYDEKRKNLPYLSKAIEGKIQDAIIAAREARTKELKLVETRETSQMIVKPPGNEESEGFADVIQDLTNNFSMK